MNNGKRLVCDVCKRYVSFQDIAENLASCKLITPESEYTPETFEILCPKHKTENIT